MTEQERTAELIAEATEFLKLGKLATRGPWGWGSSKSGKYDELMEGRFLYAHGAVDYDGEEREANGEFIVAARTLADHLLPALLKRLQAAPAPYGVVRSVGETLSMAEVFNGMTLTRAETSLRQLLELADVLLPLVPKAKLDADQLPVIHAYRSSASDIADHLKKALDKLATRLPALNDEASVTPAAVSPIEGGPAEPFSRPVYAPGSVEVTVEETLRGLEAAIVLSYAQREDIVAYNYLRGSAIYATEVLRKQLTSVGLSLSTGIPAYEAKKASFELRSAPSASTLQEHLELDNDMLKQELKREQNQTRYYQDQLLALSASTVGRAGVEKPFGFIKVGDPEDVKAADWGHQDQDSPAMCLFANGDRMIGWYQENEDNQESVAGHWCWMEGDGDRDWQYSPFTPQPTHFLSEVGKPHLSRTAPTPPQEGAPQS